MRIKRSHDRVPNGQWPCPSMRALPLTFCKASPHACNTSIRIEFFCLFSSRKFSFYDATYRMIPFNLVQLQMDGVRLFFILGQSLKPCAWGDDLKWIEGTRQGWPSDKPRINFCWLRITIVMLQQAAPIYTKALSLRCISPGASTPMYLGAIAK